MALLFKVQYLLVFFFSWFRGFFLRLWDYLFLLILPLGIGPGVPIFDCILKQMLTSNETELKCLMETTLVKENKQREKLINRFTQAAIWLYEKHELLFASKYNSFHDFVQVCVKREHPNEHFSSVIYFERWFKIHLNFSGSYERSRNKIQNSELPLSVYKTQPDLAKPGKKTMLDIMPNFSLASISDDSQQDHMVS